jgi:hypothetical protein
MRGSKVRGFLILCLFCGLKKLSRRNTMDALFALDIKCPHCFKSLMDSKVTLDNEPSIKVDIKVDGEKSWLRLSSVWGRYTIEAEK